jgi:predicted nucleotide-binding protein (sugar kinase/HSP70/actin superfamily)
MKISFPYMGTSPLVVSYLFENLGHEVVCPPVPTEKTLSLGVQYAPEFACIPFKIVLGTYLEVLEMGAEVLITSGGCGPCRAGFYGELHRRILRDLGYPVEMIIMEPPLREPLDFLRKVYRLLKPAKLSNLYHVFRVAVEKMLSLDEIESTMHKLRPLAYNKKLITKAYSEGLEMIRQADSVKEVKEAKQATLEALWRVPANHEYEPLRVGLIGEIYVVLEPAANHDIERILGDMGVYVHRSIFLSEWVRYNVLGSGEKHIRASAIPYLNQMIGGHGQNSVGEVVRYAEKGFDGVIQLAPFTCIPEIVAKSILPAISRDKDIPVLTLFLDEQTGQAGIETRLEAFVDLIKQKRRKREAS